MIINTRFTVTLWQASTVLLFFTSVTLGLFQKRAPRCFSFPVVYVFLVFSQGSDKSKYKIPQVNTMPKGKCSIRSKVCCAIYLLNTNTDMRSFKNSAFRTIKSHSSFIIVKYLSWKTFAGRFRESLFVYAVIYEASGITPQSCVCVLMLQSLPQTIHHHHS